MKPKTIKIPISKLVSHPMQTTYFSNCSTLEDAALASDFKKRGQQLPIVVMPPGNRAGLKAFTILDGHRRVQALRAAGIETAMVLIRFDLKNATKAEVEDEFLNFNSQRRQLHPLESARIAIRRFEIENGLEPGTAGSSWERAELKKRIGQALDMSGRNLDRYCRILQTPLPVQNAVINGLLGIVPAAKVAMQSDSRQSEFAEAIKDLSDPETIKGIASCYVVLPGGRHRKACDAVATLGRSLEKSIADIGDRIDEVYPSAAAPHLATLEAAAEMIGTLIAKAKNFDPVAQQKALAAELAATKMETDHFDGSRSTT